MKKVNNIIVKLGLMRNYILKKPNTLMMYTIVFSVCIHLFVLMPGNSGAVSMPAKKGNTTLINFTLDDSDNVNRNNAFEKKKNEKVKNDPDKKGEVSYSIRLVSSVRSNYMSKKGYRGSLSPREVTVAVETYVQKLRKRIERTKYYPRIARRLRYEGIVKLRFTLRRNGRLKGPVNIVKSCDHDILNKAGIETVHTANPFLPFPDRVKEDEMTFTLDIDYDLRRL
ncbi:energy transducer TonB [Spirochaetota bacterium]